MKYFGKQLTLRETFSELYDAYTLRVYQYYWKQFQ